MTVDIYCSFMPYPQWFSTSLLLLLLLQGFTGRTPELKYNHVVAVFAMRGDLNKNQCQKVIIIMIVILIIMIINIIR